MSSVPYTFADSTGNIPLAYLDANFSNVKASADTAGTVTTAAQPNITSVGTLTSLTVTGNVTASNFTGNISGNISNAVYSDTAGTVTTATQPNITSVGTMTVLTASGNIRTTGGAFVGNAAGLTSIPGANVSGIVANATYATSAGSATTTTSATTAGTVTTAAQPNITSVGTLSSLTVTGNITSSTGVMIGNASGLTNVPGANVTGTVPAATTAGTVTTAAQPNITSVGTLSSLSVSGNVTAGNLTGTLTTSAQPNITSVGTLSSLTVTGNVSSTGNVSFGQDGNGLAYSDNSLTVITTKTTGGGTILSNGNGSVILGATPDLGVLMITAFGTANRGLSWNNGNLDFDTYGVGVPGNIANVKTITSSGNIISSTVRTTPTTLSSLTAVAGARAFINDGNLVASGNFGQQVSGSGANTVPVWSDGTNWYIG